MLSTEAEPETVEIAEPFGSLSALKTAHAELMKTVSSLSGPAGSQNAERAIRMLVTRASATGMLIEPTPERTEAQQIIDYWSAEILGLPGADEIDLSRIRLSPYNALREKQPDAHDADRELERLRRQERQVVRLTAAARLAQDADWSQGYLLTGRALESAKALATNDATVKKLIEKSESRQQRKVIVFLCGLLAVSIVFANVVMFQLSEIKKQSGEIADKEQSARTDADELTAIVRKLKNDKRYADEEKNRSQLKQNELDAAIRTFSTLLKSNVLRREDLPSDILKAVDDANRVIEPDPVLSPLAVGYKSDFLGIPLGLPTLTSGVSESAFQEGKAIPYVNYSVVINKRRRIAFYTAGNLDREKRRVLPRSWTLYFPDPRLPRDVQPTSNSFADTEIDQSHLTTGNEVTWGSYFDVSEAEAANRALKNVDVFTNAVPQFDVFNHGPWAELENWILERHNPDANRVVIFTGPVLSEIDPVVGNIRLPQAFWKIAVSRPINTKDGFVVDAFVISQTNETGTKFPRTTFDPNEVRVSVERIERLTGIDFGDAVRAAGTVAAAPPGERASAGEKLAALVPDLDTFDGAVAGMAVKQLSAGVLDPNLPDAELRKVVAALTDRVQNDSIWVLTPRGRRNVLQVLALVPAETWNRSSWIDLKAHIRRGVGDLEGRARGRFTTIGDETRQALNELESRIGVLPPSPDRVDFQFAGMTRANAIAISARLKALGWAIPGEERTGQAANVNEIRYGDPDDKPAAELLVADLQALGQDKVIAAKQNSAIKKGNLEIWISQ